MTGIVAAIQQAIRDENVTDAPSATEIAEYAAFIGADLKRYPQLESLVREGLMSPLPEGWVLTAGDDGSAVYEHVASGAWLNEHPNDKVYRRRAQLLTAQFEAAGSDDQDIDRVDNGLFGSCDVHHRSATQEPTAAAATANDDDEWGGMAAAPPPAPRPASAEHGPLSMPLSARRSLRAAPSTRGGKPRVKMPSEFICPITAEVMSDPVVTVDGFSYEREAILKWFNRHDTSPCTNEVLLNKAVFPNSALRIHIREFMATHDVEPA